MIIIQQYALQKKIIQIEIFVGVLSEIRREYKISKRVPQNYLARKKIVETIRLLTNSWRILL